MSQETVPATADVVEPPVKSVGIVKAAGILGIVGGILLIVVAIIAWIAVTAQLTAENITIPDDAAAFAGEQVTGPVTAYIQADVINKHALEASGGQTYAELPQDDPVRATVMQASFLRASLFTSVVAYGVALFAAGVGVLSVLFGWALLRLASVPVVVRRSTVAAAP
ncbi:aromatic ring-opening dioxygenase LigA [Microbacterium sp. NPDC057407]|uniref:aromatic ring-opening dioxygenase LigA n=1 Tax=Microbacterium sp. NPDC057407 TaxID=3346120 RepID=UPI00366F0835